MGTPINALRELFASAGAREYFGETVSLGAHMLQAGDLAQRAAARDPLVVAALLHDVGHLLDSRHHEQAGAEWLAQWFPQAVTEPVRLHVSAKRYLCATEPGYFACLSPASVDSLGRQGGPMSAREVEEFRQQAYASEAVAVRRLDEQAKDPAAPTPVFESFYATLRRAMRAG